MVAGWIILMPLLAAPIIWAVYIMQGGFRGDGSGMAALGGGIPLGHMPLPVAMVLATSADWIPWTGIPSPISGPVPQLAALIAFGSAFVLGWLLYRQQPLLQSWSRTWILHALLAGTASAISMWMLGPPGEARVFEGTDRLTYALIYAFSCWSWVVAITGFCVRHLSAPSETWRYLADASYWMYLTHLPLVLALQVVVMRWPVHWSIKFLLIVAATFALLLLSYRYLVRGTFIGSVLNGRRYLRSADPG